jgi:hypothetical protein
LQCTLDEPNLSSKTVLVGDPVLCHLGPLGSFGHSAFPRGAMLADIFRISKIPDASWAKDGSRSSLIA